MGLLMMVVIAVAYLINSRVGALLLIFAAVYYMLMTKGSIYERLLKLIVYSTPYYPFSIFGDRQRLSLCIVAATILCILLTCSWLRRGARINMVSARKLLLFLVFVMTYFLSVSDSYEPKETIFSTYQLVILAYLIFIIPICKDKELREVKTEALLKLFVRGTCAVAITLYIQYGANVLFGVQLGELYQYNSGREVYNIYFYAKSALSLYLSVGMLYVFIEYINKKHITDIIWLVLFAGAILINNSRTGLMCFAVCAALYCMLNLKRIFGSLRVTVLLVFIGVLGLYIIQFMLETRTNLDGFADDNGRIETIVEAIRLLPKHIFTGIGGGALDYTRSSMGVSVHNFFVAYLIQFGVFGGLAVNALLLTPVFDTKSKYWYYLCCVVMGGMLFANWQNTLYIIPLYLFVFLDDRDLKRKIHG